MHKHRCGVVQDPGELQRLRENNAATAAQQVKVCSSFHAHCLRQFLSRASDAPRCVSESLVAMMESGCQSMLRLLQRVLRDALPSPQELSGAFCGGDLDAALDLATKLRYTTRIGEAILSKL